MNYIRSLNSLEDIAFAVSRIEELEAENHLLKTSGIIEVAVRNPNVMDYMKHWEGRAEAAEAKLAKAADEPKSKLPEGRYPLSDDWFREKAAAFNFDEYGYYGENNGPLPPTEKIREMNEQERQRSKEREQANKKKDE